MAKATREKKYHFDIFTLTTNESDLFIGSAEVFFERAMNGEVELEHTSYGCTRDIFELRYRPETESYAGQLRKIRKADLPEVGEPGRESTKLTLGEKEGVVEKNFFVYYKDCSLLIMSRNDNGSTGYNLSQLITACSGIPFIATPLITPEEVEKIINNKVSLRKLSVKIPKPTNPKLYPQDDISSAAINLLNKSDADYLDITFSIDPKASDKTGLSGAIHDAIRPFLSIGATKADVIADENGMIHPIDLIATRIYSTQTIRTNASFPPSGSMYKMADKAKLDKKEAIDAYFGKLGSRLV